MAPEILLNGIKISSACDMWSLGISAVEVMTADYAWVSDDLEMKEIYQQKKLLRCFAHMESNHFIRRCIQYDPKLRTSALKCLALDVFK